VPPESRQSAKRLETGGRDQDAAHPLAPLLVLQAYHAGVRRAGPLHDGRLDLRWIDVLAAGHDPVGAATHDPEPAVLADRAQVARVEPPVRLEGPLEWRAGFRTQIAVEQRVAPHLDRAGGPVRGRNTHLDSGQRRTHPSRCLARSLGRDLGTGLRQPVGREHRPTAFPCPLHQRRRSAGAPDEHGPKARRRAPGRLKQPREHRRHDGQEGDPVPFDDPEGLVRIEVP